MKNNCNILLLILMATIGLSACKKDDDNKKDVPGVIHAGLEVNAAGKSHLVTKIGSSDKDYVTADYDSEGRFIKYSLIENGNIETQSSLTYTGNTVTINAIEDGEKSTATVHLGGNGYAKEVVEINIYKDGAYNYTIKSTGKITQDSEGYVSKIESSTVETSDEPNFQTSNYTTSTEFTYLGGNLLRSVIKSDELTYTEEYEYYSDKPYVPLMFEMYTSFLLGKPSKNLVKKVTRNLELGGQSHNVVSSYIYTFDGVGLPVSATSDSGDKVSIKYIIKS